MDIIVPRFRIVYWKSNSGIEILRYTVQRYILVAPLLCFMLFQGLWILGSLLVTIQICMQHVRQQLAQWKVVLTSYCLHSFNCKICRKLPGNNTQKFTPVTSTSMSVNCLLEFLLLIRICQMCHLVAAMYIHIYFSFFFGFQYICKIYLVWALLGFFWFNIFHRSQ
jgi:hypothetical protein